MSQKKFIDKYAVIEAFPQILKGSSGFSTLFYGIAYFFYVARTFFKIIFCSGKSKFKTFVGMFKRNDKVIQGATSGISYDLKDASKILASLLSLKSRVAYTEITVYFGKEAKEVMKELYSKGYVQDLETILSLGTFSIKKERIYFRNEEEIEQDVFVTREYTEPVIKTLELKDKIHGFLSKFSYNSKHLENKNLKGEND